MIKKILYLDEQMERQAGGSNCLFTLLTYLDKERFLPILASPDGELATEYKSEGGKFFKITFPKIWRVSFRIGRFRFFNPFAFFANMVQICYPTVKLLKIIRDEKIDLLHTNSFRAHWAGFIASSVSKRPIIWHLREIPRNESIFIRIIGNRYVNRIIFMSEAIQNAYLQGKNTNKRMVVIYDGITLNGNMDDIKDKGKEEFGIPYEIPVVGIVARLVPIKGHRYFVEAAQKIVKDVKEVRFLVVGSNLPDGSEKEFFQQIQSLVKSAGLSEYFVFTGFYPQPLKIMPSIDILVCPSIEEGFGMVVLEALACGTPVIASNVGGIPEILHSGGGILVPSKDPSAIAREVMRLLKNPDEQKRLSIEGIKNVRRNFPFERTVDKIEKLYEDILNGCNWE